MVRSQVGPLLCWRRGRTIAQFFSLEFAKKEESALRSKRLTTSSMARMIMQKLSPTFVQDMLLGRRANSVLIAASVALFVPDILTVEADTVAYLESVDSRGDVDVMRRSATSVPTQAER